MDYDHDCDGVYPGLTSPAADGGGNWHLEKRTRVVWALPDQIIYSKRDGYGGQSEYRFAFADRRVLKVGNATQRLQFGEVAPLGQAVISDPVILKVGDLRKLVRLHSRAAVTGRSRPRRMSS